MVSIERYSTEPAAVEGLRCEHQAVHGNFCFLLVISIAVGGRARIPSMQQNSMQLEFDGVDDCVSNLVPSMAKAR